MNKETQEQEIEVELLNPEEIETQEEENELSVLALDGDLIEELYQEQMQEQQTEKSPGEMSHGGKASEKHGEAVSAKADETGKTWPEKIVLPDAEEPDEIDLPEKILLDDEETVESGSLAAGYGTADHAAARASAKGMAADGAAVSMGMESAAANGVSADGAAANGTAAEGAAAMGLAAEAVASNDGSANNTSADGVPVEAGGAAAEKTDADSSETPDGENTGEEAGERQKKKKTLLRRVLKGALIALELVILAFIIYVVAIVIQADSTTDLLSRLSQSLLGKTVLSVMIEEEYESNVQETINSEQISTNEGLDVASYTLEGDYTSFVIFGVDARGDEFDSGTNSDTIIIVTIQNETGRVRMASIYRDTYLQIESSNGGVHYAKANSAYSSGGAVRALNMLNTNFDLALEDYVVVNFTGVADIIDALGGLDITLSEGEVEQLNYHLAGSIYATGLSGDKITSAGLNHLNGVQALTYARIRKTVFTDPDTGEEYNNDYGRTKRQQYVISLLAAKAKEASVSELTSIVNRVFSYNTDEEKVIGTTYSFNEIISMIPLALDFTLDGGEGYPDNKTTMIMSDLNGADCVIATDLVSDVTALHEFLYDEEDYSPTAVVRNIADTILDRAEAYGTSD